MAEIGQDFLEALGEVDAVTETENPAPDIGSDFLSAIGDTVIDTQPEETIVGTAPAGVGFATERVGKPRFQNPKAPTYEDYFTEFAGNVGTGVADMAKDLLSLGRGVVKTLRPSTITKFVSSELEKEREMKKLAETDPEAFGQKIVSETRKAAAKGIERREIAADFIEGFLLNLDKTAGFDSSKAGLAWDPNIAIDRWFEQPVEAMGDVMTMVSVARGFVPKGKAKGVIAKNLDRIDSMKKTGALPSNTPFDDIVANKEALRPMLNRSAKTLDNPNYFSAQSRKLADDVSDLARKEAKRLNKALKPVENVAIDKRNVAGSIKDQLRLEGLMDGDELLNVGVSNKPLMKKVMKMIDDDRPMTVKEVQTLRRQIDDKIDWIETKDIDDSLKVARKALDDEIVRIAPEEYAVVKGRIHDRLDKFSMREKSLKKTPKKEATGRSMFNSESEVDEIVTMLEGLKVPEAERVLGTIDSMKAWKAYNEFLKTSDILPSFTRVKGVPLHTGGLGRRISKARVGLAAIESDIIRRTSEGFSAVGKGAIGTAKGAARATAEAGKLTPLAATLFEDVPTRNKKKKSNSRLNARKSPSIPVLPENFGATL